MSRAEREKWDAKYAAGEGGERFSGEPAGVLAWLPEARPGALALDVAAGMLRHSRVLAGAGYRVLALDVSREGFRRAGAVPDTIRRVVVDLDTQRLDGARFDVIVVTHYVNRELHRALAGALRPGGHLLLEARVDPANRIDAIVRPFRLAPKEALHLFAGLEVVESDAPPGEGVVRYLFRRP